MTTEGFQNYIETKREFEFIFEGKKFLITYGKDNGGQYIQLGQEFSAGKKFYSYRELMADAKVGNHFLREFIKSL